MTAQAIPAGKFKTLSHENLPKGASMSHNVIGAWRGKRWKMTRSGYAPTDSARSPVSGASMVVLSGRGRVCLDEMNAKDQQRCVNRRSVAETRILAGTTARWTSIRAGLAGMSGVVISARDSAQKFDSIQVQWQVFRAAHNIHKLNYDAASDNEIKCSTDTTPEAGDSLPALGAILRQECRRRAGEAPRRLRHPDTGSREGDEIHRSIQCPRARPVTQIRLFGKHGLEGRFSAIEPTAG